MESQKTLAPRDRVRRLRRDQTEAERRLWARLRRRQLCHAKFRRQHPVGPFITDFCCPAYRLVVELDGGQHAVQVDVDQARTAYLKQHGYRVLRFWNHEVMKSVEAVLQQITTALRDPHPDPLPGQGEGAENAASGCGEGEESPRPARERARVRDMREKRPLA